MHPWPKIAAQKNKKRNLTVAVVDLEKCIFDIALEALTPIMMIIEMFFLSAIYGEPRAYLNTYNIIL